MSDRTAGAKKMAARGREWLLGHVAGHAHLWLEEGVFVKQQLNATPPEPCMVARLVVAAQTAATPGIAGMVHERAGAGSSQNI